MSSLRTAHHISSRIISHATVLIAAILIAYELFIPPRVGLANNGDFGKVTAIFGLHGPPEDEYRFADLKFSLDPKYRWKSGFYSSETVLAGLGVFLNKKFTSTHVFDMRWMGAIHGFLFVLATYLAQPLLEETPVLSRVVFSAAALLILADYMYASYFNSFYMDTATYVFLLLAIVLFLRAARKPRWRNSAALIVCAVFMALSKPQHAVLGFWIAALLASFGRQLWPRYGLPLSSVSAVIIAGASVASLRATPKDYAAYGYYSVIFYQVLPHSTDVQGSLTELGLDPSYRKFAGTHAFSEGSGMGEQNFVRAFMKQTSYIRLAYFFLTHPRDARLALEASLAEAGRERPPMGNFDVASGLEWKQSRAFPLWSDAKRKVFYRHGARYLACYILISIAFCLTAFIKRRFLSLPVMAGAWTLAGMAITAMLAASLADAVEVTRHHLMSAALLDIEIVLALALALCARDSNIRAGLSAQRTSC